MSYRYQTRFTKNFSKRDVEQYVEYLNTITKRTPKRGCITGAACQAGTVKIFKTRDSATSALRKLGIQAHDYDLFITKIDGKFECKLGAATEHLESLKPAETKAAKAPASTETKAAKAPASTETKAAKAPASTETKSKRTGISATARALILAGKTNQEVWAILKETFSLDDSKKHYPTWYRCEMKRKGLLPKEA